MRYVQRGDTYYPTRDGRRRGLRREYIRAYSGVDHATTDNHYNSRIGYAGVVCRVSPPLLLVCRLPSDITNTAGLMLSIYINHLFLHSLAVMLEAIGSSFESLRRHELQFYKWYILLSPIKTCYYGRAIVAVPAHYTYTTCTGCLTRNRLVRRPGGHFQEKMEIESCCIELTVV